MTQPNFETMTDKELQKYVLEHREDQTAFYAYIDKLHQEKKWVEMPPLTSLEDLENYPNFINHVNDNSKA